MGIQIDWTRIAALFVLASVAVFYGIAARANEFSANDVSQDQLGSLVYAPWSKFCLKGKEANAKQVCFTGKDGRIESGEPVVAAVVIEPEGEPKKILRITLPLGVQFVHGTRMIVDKNAPEQSPYVICFKNGCMADYDATPELLSLLKSGQVLWVQAINGNGKPLSFPLPLAEFAAAFDGPPLDPKVFEANQAKLMAELKQRASRKDAKQEPAASASTAVAAAPASQMTQAAPVENLVAPAGRRVALVIGNSSYRYMPALPNPRNDAADVESALKGLGFETVLATDLDRSGMNAAMEKFSRLVPGANVAVVYYSGHGMQFEGKNYLLPTDASLESAADVNRFRLLPVDDLIDVLRSANGLQLIVLDACRNNPVERDFKNKVASLPGGNRDAASTRGFTRVDARNGLVITYSTAPNDVAADGNGRNSPFTQAFLRNVGTPDVDVLKMLYNVQREVYNSSGAKQLPEVTSLYVGPDIRLKTSAR